MGRIWIPPSSSSVARLAMSVIDSSSLISAELSTSGMFEVESLEGLVISLLLISKI
jgi:hypothetical protein